MNQTSKDFASKIIKEYEPDKLRELKDLDRKAKKPAIIFAYAYGFFGTLLLVLGFILATRIYGNTTFAIWLGVFLVFIGSVIVSTNPIIFEKNLYRRKKKYSDKIISKSKELLENE